MSAGELKLALRAAEDFFEQREWKLCCANAQGTGPMSVFLNIVGVMLMGVPAMILHECGHIAVALVCGVKVKKVGVSRKGLYTIREAGPKWINIAVSSAGPLVNLLLAIMFWNSLTTFAEVNLVACIYNLLPITNSDGSRILALLSDAGVVPQGMPEMRPHM